MNIYIGCSGWSYSGWKGTFYPKELESKKWLSYYARFFKFVEVDSTYYSIPSRFVVKGWKDKTPDDFRFTLKFPKEITHGKRLLDASRYLIPFFHALEPLVDKTLMLLIQLPPYLTKKNGYEYIENLVPKLDNRYRYALEVREPSWFDDGVCDFLKENNMPLVWSVRDDLTTPPMVTSHQIYIRFIGDRSISEMDFGKIIRDRQKEMKEYANHIIRMQQGDGIGQQQQQIAIAFNNHFAGFGPQSANEFLRLMDKPEIDWKGALHQKQQQVGFDSLASETQRQPQTSISDFTHL
ncbi:MAG: DUF72 domain-containing protein [Nitrosopumilus sp.]|nr:DUF72 domain-containing protein [Nitrosopumilus sp.]